VVYRIIVICKFYTDLVSGAGCLFFASKFILFILHVFVQGTFTVHYFNDSSLKKEFTFFLLLSLLQNLIVTKVGV
jgi:hypothetical protein